MPNLVVSADDGVPVLDHRLVHIHDRGERAAVEGTGAGVAEMGVGGEQDGHGAHLLSIANPPQS
jgi:hypothetical protein